MWTPPFVNVFALVSRCWDFTVQGNLDMTDHYTTDFCIWRTICLVPVRCISSIRHMYTTDLHMMDQFSWSHWVCHIQVHLYIICIFWHLIIAATPPFIPTVNGKDDTSNFDEFEKERDPPYYDGFRTRREFSGKDLPFLGFTYTRPLAATKDR